MDINTLFYILCFTTLVFSAFYLFEKISNAIKIFSENKKFKKHNIENLEFYIEKVNKENFKKKYKSTSRVPEIFIRCNFNFKYKDNIYNESCIIEAIYDELIGNHVYSGYDDLERVRKMNETERKNHYAKKIIKYVEQQIYNIELEKARNKVLVEFNNDELKD